MMSVVIATLLLLPRGASHAQQTGVGTARESVAPEPPVTVLPHRERVEAINDILEHRLEPLLPELMRETGIEMWLVISGRQTRWHVVR